MKKSKKTIKSSTHSNSKPFVFQNSWFRWRWFWVCFTGTGLLLIASWGKLKSSHVAGPQKAMSQGLTLKSPQTLDELLRLSPGELVRCDIALMDLLCAQGLPGSGKMSLSDYLANLNQWANHVRSETEKHLHKFRDNPSDFYNSEGYFKMLIMAVVM